MVSNNGPLRLSTLFGPLLEPFGCHVPVADFFSISSISEKNTFHHHETLLFDIQEGSGLHLFTVLFVVILFIDTFLEFSTTLSTLGGHLSTKVTQICVQRKPEASFGVAKMSQKIPGEIQMRGFWLDLPKYIKFDIKLTDK